jgi:hypothetical protein
MSFIFKDGVRVTTIESIVNDIFSRRGNYYYFIGKILPWNDPFNPDPPNDTQGYEHDTRNRIFSVKKINIADVSFVIPRIDWVSGTVYDRFDGDYSPSNPATSGAIKLQDSKFYVLNSSFNVYKCLDNNNGSISTVEPNGTDITVITTSDGYVWKYLYTIPLSSRNKFFTESLMPVQRSVFNPFYSNGEVDRVSIENRGSGYLGNSEVSLQVNGTFKSNSGNVVASVIPVFDVAGSIVDVIVRNGGNNYFSANISINDAAATGTSFYKNLTNVSLTDPGSDYFSNVQANTIVVLTTSGTQPTRTANVLPVFGANSVVGFTIIDGGSGYTPSIANNTTLAVITTGDSQPTTNATATLTFSTSALLTPVLVNGVVDRVVINDPGIGYRSNVQTSISVIGDGANASFIPFINESGELEDVIITSRGEGYTSIDLAVIGNGTGANITADISTGDLTTNQSYVELGAVSGAIYAFRVVNGGNNYTTASISIIGDGKNFAGNVILSNSNTIVGVTIANPGSGYTFANVVITGDGSNANLTAILPPPGGHGKDAVRELFANTLLFFSSINNERIHGVDVVNDFRQTGIIKNLKQFGSEKTFANINGTSSYLVTFNTLNNSLSQPLQRDTVLELSNASYKKFVVIDTVTANTRALLTNLNNHNIGVGNVLYDPITQSNFIVANVIQQPTINKFSGDLLFIDNRTSVSYSDRQLVTLKTTLKL